MNNRYTIHYTPQLAEAREEFHNMSSEEKYSFLITYIKHMYFPNNNFYNIAPMFYCIDIAFKWWRSTNCLRWDI